METIECLSELAGGLVLLIGTGYLIGHLLRLGSYYEDRSKHQEAQPGEADLPVTDTGDQHQHCDL